MTMRIDKLKLHNFRGFEELEINFPEGEEGLTVLVGENGSGKTSILKAISLFFRVFINGLYSSGELETIDKPDNISLNTSQLKSNIRKGEKFFTNQIEFSVLETVFQSTIEIQELSSKIRLEPPINRIIGEFPYDKLSDQFKSEYGKDGYIALKKIRDTIRKQPKIITYYNVDRFVADEPSLKAKDITLISPIDAFTNSFSAKISFNDFFEWFRNTEDYENELIINKDDRTIRLPSLEAIRSAVLIFLPKFSSPRVRRQPRERLVFKDNGHLLEIANLSHGERLIFAIVGDIIRRLSIANPDLKNPCLGEGVVMIDEIEQHLHPSWQRTIIPNLRKTFPNIQFIVTTHSPQVLSNVKRENVFVLEDFKLVQITPHTYGKDSNSILYDLFGVRSRPEHAKKEFLKLYRLMDDPAKDTETQNMLNNLEVKYGKSDPDLLEAKLHFEFMTR